MKKVKFKEGYTRLPNSVLQVLCSLKIRPEVLRTIFAIFRLTFGWGTPERVLSYGQITLMTGLALRNQWRAVKEALKLNLIKRYNLRGESESNLKPIYVYSFNLQPKTWKVRIETTVEHKIRLWNYVVSSQQRIYLSSKMRIPISSKMRISIKDILSDYPIK